MSIVVRPATLARFGDVATMFGPKNPDSSVRWCLSHRLDAKTNRALVGRDGAGPSLTARRAHRISPAPARRIGAPPSAG
jgi:hypothetical protein